MLPKLLAGAENNVIFLTHFLAPEEDKTARVYNAALTKLGKLGRIIQVENKKGAWVYHRNAAIYQSTYNEVFFEDGQPHFIEKYNQPLILKNFHSIDGRLNTALIQDEIADKNLFFSGYSLYHCVRNTIFSAAPVAAVQNRSQTFTLLKDYLWGEIICDHIMYNQVLKIPDGYNCFFDRYYGIPAWPSLKKALHSYYVYPSSLEERELVRKIYDYYGINLFFHCAGEEYPLNDDPRNKLRIDLVLR
ncbi:MAG: hypothetical protein LBD99_01125 [Candidatus Margulisbacteria bacterium]|jgi:hypothetical protein|nr:hypothetical protein [Candidatus Margulisiibacteriota bacterium]